MALTPPRTLPPGLLIQTGQWVWSSLWQVMMSQMAPRDRDGAYIRPASQFRHDLGLPPELEKTEPEKIQPEKIQPEKTNSPHPAEPNRYRLIVGLSCPWAHRTLVVRALKGLEETIAVTLVVPRPEAGGWIFTEPFAGCQTLAQAYALAQPGYQGRCTVPVLWDDRHNTIVNNESADIIRLLNDRCNHFAQVPQRDLDPPDLRPTMEDWNTKIYHRVNNGVYRCGFAQTQAAYEQACGELFEQLDELEATLQHQRYLCGDRLTLADIRLFTTLFRFDAVYYSLFKCSRRRIQDYAALGGYGRELYQLPGVAETCNLQQVKQDYFGNLFPLNPGGIVPQSSQSFDWLAPHDRDHLPLSAA
ncbi:glutathione S-transferase family protein [Prochlorothrix hollandica]|uniref:Glutathione S-transferase n=1 Tax=Prochlorothrix hollandica PCC 9006 = CALU 1027 TaxID=317619 RepID=A0A0M2PTB7_PROHO|nr:glutathione S-transferase C-terminal domain-containing protein [Prochlorothrix hollandica]KKI98387.1 glutathione S-transferase [Prochlorothrix hollandica PCC 9006 = CALU 1027]